MLLAPGEEGRQVAGIVVLGGSGGDYIRLRNIDGCGLASCEGDEACSSESLGCGQASMA